MRKKKILIPYSYNQNWIGGTYYIENLLKSLEMSKSFKSKFDLYIFTDSKSFKRLAVKINLPMKKVSWSFLYKVKNKILKLINLNLVNKKYDLVFPYNLSRMQRMSENRICWIPDFQEKYYPEFFSESEANGRDSVYKMMIESEKNIVFSSKNALEDYEKFYPQNNMNKFVLNFATFHDFTVLPSKEEVLKKYCLEKRFFICSNQFWIHKNHKVAIMALKKCVEINPNIRLIFTGKEHDYRAPDYTDEVKKLQKKIGLEGYSKFLGFIDRKDQLALMRDSVAVVQPSLFEGWSTVVEDAKALSKKIICSNIDVHKEQLGDKGVYFESRDSDQLAKLMLKVFESPVETIDYNYGVALKKFGEDFEEIIEKVIP